MVIAHEYFHEIDDLIDKGIADPQRWLRCLAMANTVYSTDYYCAHARELHLIIQSMTSAYAISVLWENDKEEWKRQWADVSRHCGLQLIFAVATIQGGYDLMNSIALQLHEYAYLCHHDKDGKPL